MNKHFIAAAFFTLVVLLPFCTFAQKNTFKLNPKMIAGRDYEMGVIIGRLKTELTATQATNMQKCLREISTLESKPAFAQAALFEQKMRKEKSDINLSDFIEIKIPATIKLETAINKLLETGAFLYAEPALIYQPLYITNDKELGMQYFHDIIKSYAAWDISKGDSNVVIGIVDSGFDFNHPDLVKKFKYNQADPIDGKDNDNDGFIDNHKGWDFAGANSDNIQADNNPQVITGTDHGIAVAGCAAADTDNSIGVAGVGFNCKLLSTKHGADTGGQGLYRTWDGILYLAQHGAKVINCSFGGAGASPLIQDIINKVVLELDVVVIAASGNDGTDELFYPASYNNVLSVGASDGNDAKASFSNFGTKIDITAPGSNIFTTHLFNKKPYAYTGGTSFSSPIVAGAAGLVRSKFPTLQAVEVMELLRTTADTVFYQVNDTDDIKHLMGRGRLDVEKALTQKPPSMRIVFAQPYNNAEQAILQNESGYMSMKIKNLLFDTNEEMTAKLTIFSSDVVVEKPIVKIGLVKKGAEIDLGKDGFKIRVNSMTVLDKVVTCKIEYFQNGFTDYEFFNITINQSYVIIDVNRIRTSADSRGMFAYHDDERSYGEGFKLDESTSKLFEMSLIIGQSKTILANAARPAENGKAWDKDFFPFKQIHRAKTSQTGMAYWEGEFNDSKAGASRINVSIKHNIRAWTTAPNTNFIVAEYKLLYQGSRILDNFHLGLFADWDVSVNGQKDYAAYSADNKLGYVYDKEKSAYVGIKLLNNDRINCYAINNNEKSGETPFGLYDGFTDEEKFQAISSKLSFTEAGQLTEGADVSQAVSAGPYNLKQGDSLTVAFALVAGETLDEMIEAGKNAEIKYLESIGGNKPLAAENEFEQGSISVYPNPSSDQIFVSFANATKANVRVLDMQGREIFALQGNQITNQIVISTERFKSGMYLLHISDDKKQTVKPITIVK